ncbi:MAG: helix-turn-helix transcriptional regulator [Rhodospirillales bacterium]|nr:helix-turn-helix transcriptional regulator [Rhodospirillales bacterium]
MMKRVAAERYDLTLLHFEKLDDLAKTILEDLYNRVIWRPIIVIFDKGSEGDFEEAIRIGADDFLLTAEMDVKTLVRSMILAIERTNRSRARSGLPSNRELRTTSDSIMDRLPMGVLLVNWNGQVMLINRKAQEIAAMKDGFQVDAEGRCLTNKREETQALYKLIKQTAEPSDDAVDTEFSLSLTRPSMKQPLVLLVTPVGGSGTEKRSGGAAIFISDPEDAAEISNEVLTHLYGLTNAEARVVIGLSQGKRLETLSEELGVTISTTRHQLKQIFRKTDTTRQSELIKLILTGPAAIRGNEQAKKREETKPVKKTRR